MTDKGKFDISRTKTKETDAITGKEGVGQEDYFTDKDNTEVLGYYNNPKSEWKSLITAYIWNKIKFWDLSSKKAYKKIMTDSPYIMFNVVAEIGRKDGDSTAIKSQRVVIEDLGEKTTTTPAKEAAPTIIYPGFSAPPAAGNTSDFFADNSWAPTP
jgi:hypothetical protein